MYKISVIIPIYNVEKYIEDCLESVLMQISHNIQILCINDGTQDKSMEKAKYIVSKCDYKIQEQFIFIDQLNQGLSAARNTGIDAATGEYISFLDSDDKLDSEYFSSILEALEKDDYDIIDFNFETSEGVITKIRNESFNSVFSSMNWYSWARVVNKKLFDKNRFTDGIYYEDIDLTPRLYIESNKILYLDKVLYWYRTNNEGITQSLSKENNVKTLNSLDTISSKYFKLYSESNNPYYAFMALQVYFLLCLNASRRFDMKKSFYYIEKYQMKITHIKIKNLPISLFFSSPKILVFHSYPKIYSLGYSSYRNLRNTLSLLK